MGQLNIVLKAGGSRASWWKEHLFNLLPEAKLYLTGEEMNRDDIDCAVVWKPEPGWLKTFKNLKCIVSIGAGIDHVLCDPGLPVHLPIIRTTSSDLKVRMREYVTLHVLRLHRRLQEVTAAQMFREWR